MLELQHINFEEETIDLPTENLKELFVFLFKNEKNFIFIKKSTNNIIIIAGDVWISNRSIYSVKSKGIFSFQVVVAVRDFFQLTSKLR